MNNETKIGMFILVGIVLFGTAIFLLGDFSFKKYYPVFIEFKDVAGLPDKSNVKLSGVEVGKIKKVYMEGEFVIVKVNVFEGVEIYRDAKFSIGSTSMIGSKFLQIDQGTRLFGTIKSGDRVKGDDSLPLDRTLSKAVGDIRELLAGFKDKDIGGNLDAVLSNLREATAGLNQMIMTSRPHAENALEKLDSVMARLDNMLEKTDRIVSRLDSGEGAIGALMSDKKVKEDVTLALGNLKDATASAKDALKKITGFRTYLKFGSTYEPLIRASKKDVGIKIYPKDGRYYYLGGANIINTKNIDEGTDYFKRNTIDAFLGWEVKGFDLYAGVLKGAGGAGVKYKPFYANSTWDKLSFLFEASDFSRNRYIKSRRFHSAKYDAGVQFDISKYVSAGIKVEDLAEVKRVNYNASIIFEDKDIAYLFGLVSFSGTK